jgi:L-fucose isomerase-like protein
MNLLPAGGNHTTPGRMDTPNITEEDTKEAEALADELIAGAALDNLDIERKYVIESCKAYVLVKKLLDLYDCNAFTFPCPDACSTLRFNDMEFTLCLNHSLLTEQGIPSTCDSDINSMMAMFMLTTLSGKAPYHGNGWPVLLDEDGKALSEWHLDPENDLPPDVDRTNLYMIDHSTQIRKKQGIDLDCSPYGLRHFAFDKKFGAVLRYDHNQDIGQTITLCRFSPDCKKMLIGKGSIVGGGGYDTDNCNNYVIFRVADQKKFLEAHKFTGNHMALVYGDYVEELTLLAEAFKLEPLIV